MISGNLLITIIIIVVLGYAIFFAPINVPSWLRTIFAIILAIILFAWLLNLIGVVAF